MCGPQLVKNMKALKLQLSQRVTPNKKGKGGTMPGTKPGTTTDNEGQRQGQSQGQRGTTPRTNQGTTGDKDVPQIWGGSRFLVPGTTGDSAKDKARDNGGQRRWQEIGRKARDNEGQSQGQAGTTGG